MHDGLFDAERVHEVREVARVGLDGVIAAGGSRIGLADAAVVPDEDAIAIGQLLGRGAHGAQAGAEPMAED